MMQRYSNRGTYTPEPKQGVIAAHYFDGDTRFWATCPDCGYKSSDPDCFYCQGKGYLTIAHYGRDKTVFVHEHWSATYHPTYGFVTLTYLFGKSAVSPETEMEADHFPELQSFAALSQLTLFASEVA